MVTQILSSSVATSVGHGRSHWHAHPRARCQQLVNDGCSSAAAGVPGCCGGCCAGCALAGLSKFLLNFAHSAPCCGFHTVCTPRLGFCESFCLEDVTLHHPFQVGLVARFTVPTNSILTWKMCIAEQGDSSQPCVRVIVSWT